MSIAWVMFNIFVIFDTTQGIASSALRASGQQKFGAVLTFVSYFVIGIPVSSLLMFYYDMGIWGLWLGPTLACAFNTVVYLIIFNRTKWDELIIKMA
jgi:multidrug resistance protein, MATE family